MNQNDIQGWIWGAFLLSWIWGIGNNTYIALFTYRTAYLT